MSMFERSNNILQAIEQRFDDEIRRVAGWEERRQRAEILDQIADQISHQWEKAAAYTNVVLAVGYAGLFAAWTTLGPGDHPRMFAWAGLLAVISLLLFILWEVSKMTLLGLFMRSVVPLIDEEPHRVGEVLDRINRCRSNLNLRFARLWLPVLASILASGLSAAAIVIILFVMRL